MSNERLKAFKERIKTDPEYKAHLKARHKLRMQTDPKYRERIRAKQRRADSKKKAKRLNTPEKLETHQQFKLNQFKCSMMTDEEKKQHKNNQKKALYEKFFNLHGINYNTFLKWRKISGLTNIQDVIEYRNANGKQFKPYAKRNQAFKEKYGVSEYQYAKHFKPAGYTLPEMLERKAKIDNRHKENESLSKPIKQEIKPIKQYDKNQQYIDRYGVSYNTLMHYKKLHGFNTIEESLQWYKYSFGIDPSKCSKTKESAWQAMQNKISNLNCVISIESIRDAKINELQNNFYQQYGAM